MFTDRIQMIEALKKSGLSSRKIRKAIRDDARKLSQGNLTAYLKYEVSTKEDALRVSKLLREPFSDAERQALGLKPRAHRKRQKLDIEALPVPDIDQIQDTREGSFVYTKEEKISSIERINSKRALKFKLREAADAGRNSLTLIMALITLLILIGVVIYTFSSGWNTFSWDFITGDYHQETTAIIMDQEDASDPDAEFSYDTGENEFFSTRWGIAFQDTQKIDGSYDLQISYIAQDSPLKRLKDRTAPEDGYVNVLEGTSVTTLLGMDDTGKVVVIGTRDKAEGAAEKFDTISYLTSGFLETGGFGIGGALIATLWMILFSLVIALPLGIGGAVYLSVYARPGRVTTAIKSMIDMISGIPSIIFGLAGAIIFIPIFSWHGRTGTILSGSATLACMVLPTIIKSTEEAINTIPKSLSNASLALGASQTQTVFRVILPNSVPGVLTGTLLAIGRIIGESAALVFATGSAIMDSPGPMDGAASLAVYIWKVMQGENPNYAAASAAAMLIVIVVLILNILVKVLASRFNRFKPQGPEPFLTRIFHKAQDKLKTRKQIRESILKEETR